MLTCSAASEDLVSPPNLADSEQSSLSNVTPTGSATSRTTGRECQSSETLETLTPSSVQLWPTAKVASGDYQNGANGERFLNLSGAVKQHVELWPKASAHKTTKNRTAPTKMKEDGCQTALADATFLHSSSPPECRASRPVPPASDLEAAMTVGSGRRLSAWLSDCGPAGAFLKTLLASPRLRSPLRSLTWTLKGYAGCPDEPSQKSSADLTLWDMTSRETGMESLGFRLCRLSVSELSTDGTDCGLSPDAEMWTTPTVRDSNSVAKCTRGAGIKAAGNELIQPLTVQADSFQTGAEPSLKKEPTESRGQLSPDFVCWLMGYPAGYLNYADSEMPLSRKSRRKSSVPSLQVKE